MIYWLFFIDGTHLYGHTILKIYRRQLPNQPYMLPKMSQLQFHIKLWIYSSIEIQLTPNREYSNYLLEYVNAEDIDQGNEIGNKYKE